MKAPSHRTAVSVKFSGFFEKDPTAESPNMKKTSALDAKDLHTKKKVIVVSIPQHLIFSGSENKMIGTESTRKLTRRVEFLVKPKVPTRVFVI